MQNRSVIPGLIDALVHLKSIPGAVQRQDDEATTKNFFAQQMRAYVASGVTSVLDAAAPPSVIKIISDYSDSAAPGPTVYYLTPFVTPKDGYFSTPDLRTSAYSDMPAPVVKAEDVSAIFSARRGERAVGAKVTFEDGFGPVAVWRTFDKTMREAILRESQQRAIPLFIHSMKEAMTAMALELKPRGLMHVGFQRGKPSDELLKNLKASGASVVSTRAATINAARMIGVEDRAGSLAVGKSADLVIYDDDPMIEIKSFRRPAYVMKAGILRTPAKWLDDKSPL